MYFSVRKPQVTPDEPEAQPDEPEALPDDEAGEEADVDEAPAPPRPAVRVVWDGCLGPSRWLTARLGVWPSLGIQGTAVWACGFYGPAVAAGIIGGWTLGALALVPREDKDRWAATIERWDARRHAPETLDEGPAGEPDETPASPIPGILWKLIADAPGTHLKTVAQHLTDHTPGETIERADVRAKLGALRIPVRGSVRDAAGKVNEGVHRDDLTAWEQALPPTGPTDPSPAAENAVATPVTSDVANPATPVATPLLRLRKALSGGAD